MPQRHLLGEKETHLIPKKIVVRAKEFGKALYRNDVPHKQNKAPTNIVNLPLLLGVLIIERLTFTYRF